MCNVCICHKRDTHRFKRREEASDPNEKMSVMWKAVSGEVRATVELEFRRLQKWLKEGKRSNQDIGVQ